MFLMWKGQWLLFCRHISNGLNAQVLVPRQSNVFANNKSSHSFKTMNEVTPGKQIQKYNTT